MVFNVLLDGADQFLDGVKAATADALLGQITKPTFDQIRGRLKSPSGLAPSAEKIQREGGDSAEVFLPLHIVGVRNDAILLTDRAEVHVIGQDGRVVYHGTGDRIEVAREGPIGASSSRLFADGFRSCQVILPAGAGR